MKKIIFLILCLSIIYTAKAINFIHQVGWLESACVTWSPVESTTLYEVFYTGEGFTGKKIDTQLIRYYGSYFRADVLGLKAGNYTIKVVAIDSVGVRTDSLESQIISVLPHDRSGFGFSAQSPAGTSSGAYNDDGTLPANAKVIYLTNNSATTVKLDVVTSDKGAVTSCTGIGEILKARQKGYDTTPLVIRIIGKVTKTALDASADALGSDDDLQIKGARGYTELNTTIEGVGNDATAYGWGILVRNCKNIEIRNIGFMNFPEDGVSLNTDNANIWVHHCDFFYGQNRGGDKDKGDGSLDSKESGWLTISYNHFWDSGKCNLLGNGDETPEFLTYHHNWYDHSDSRHPRVRSHRVHLYNNYFDGNSKYGVGAAAHCPSIFSENNYFKNCKYPMLISRQGSDIAGGDGGTFSSENGGIIKAYNNHIEGATRYMPYSETNKVEFDAYEVANRKDIVPATVTAKQGGCPYLNFDTDEAIMGAAVYPCSIDAVADVPAKVKAFAGRMNGGDLKFTFTDADNTLATPRSDIVSGINNYTSALVFIQGNGESGNGGDDDNNNVAGEGGNPCALIAAGASSGFTIVGNTSTSYGSVTVNGTTYSCCLKIESSTKISFTITEPKMLTLIFRTSEGGKKIKINNTDFITDANGQVTTQLQAGTHNITKNDVLNLFYISLSGTTDLQNIKNNTISYFNAKIHNPEKKEITIFDVSGRKIAKFNADFNMAGLTKGVYLLEIQGEETIKIVK